eukprot:5077007-Prorocentrum_lima.AAC.1
MPSREKGRLEAKFALGQPFPTPPMASKLESILRVDLYDCLPTHIVKKCMAYDLVTRTMRDIMPASDLSRMSMAKELQMA